MSPHTRTFVFVSVLLATGLGAQASWSQLSPTTSPPGRTGAAFASDGGGLLVFAGQTLAGMMNDTWRFDGTGWTQLALTGSPPAARYRHAAAWYLTAGKLVVFGGGLSNLGSSRQSDTWEFDGSAWAQVTPASTTPSARWWHSMAYDLTSDRVLMFGGQDSTGRLNDTWHWDGLDWTLLSPSNVPPVRERAAMATNFATSEIVLFGGNPGGGVELGDTWIWNGADWNPVTTATIPYGTGTRNAGMTFDLLRNRMVLFGGITGGVFRANTWEFDGNDWTDRGASPLTPRTFPSIAYVLGLGKTYLFSGYGGGSGTTAIYFPGTWEYQTNQPGSFQTTGAGCSSSAGTPSLAATTPWIGETMDLVISGLSTAAVPVLSIGFSSTIWAGGSLPFNLAGFGAPTCDLLVSADSNVFLGNTGGTATWSWAIPNDPAAIGYQFFTQALAGDFSAGFSLAASNRGDVVIGAL